MVFTIWLDMQDPVRKRTAFHMSQQLYIPKTTLYHWRNQVSAMHYSEIK